MEDEDGTCLLDVLCDPQALNDFLHGTKELLSGDLLINSSSGEPSLFTDTPSPVSLLADDAGSHDTPISGCVDLSFLDEALLASPAEGEDSEQICKPLQVEAEVPQQQEEEVETCDILQQSLQEADITEHTLALEAGLAQSNEVLSLYPSGIPSPLPPYMSKPLNISGVTTLHRDTQVAVEPPQPSLLAVGPGCPSLKPIPPQLMGLLPGNIFPAPPTSDTSFCLNHAQGSKMIIQKTIQGLTLSSTVGTTAPPDIILQRTPLPIQPKLPVNIQPRLVQISPKPSEQKSSPGLSFIPPSASQNILLSSPVGPRQPLPSQSMTTLNKPVSLQLVNQGGSIVIQPQSLFQGQSHFILPSPSSVNQTAAVSRPLLGTTNNQMPSAASLAGQLVDGSQIVTVRPRQLNFSPVFTTPTGQLTLRQGALLSGPLQLQSTPPTVFQMPAQIAGAFSAHAQGQQGGLVHTPALGKQITLINTPGVLAPDLTSVSIVNRSSLVQSLPFVSQAQMPMAGGPEEQLRLPQTPVLILPEKPTGDAKNEKLQSILQQGTLPSPALVQGAEAKTNTQPSPVITILQAPPKDTNSPEPVTILSNHVITHPEKQQAGKGGHTPPNQVFMHHPLQETLVPNPSASAESLASNISPAASETESSNMLLAVQASSEVLSVLSECGGIPTPVHSGSEHGDMLASPPITQFSASTPSAMFPTPPLSDRQPSSAFMVLSAKMQGQEESMLCMSPSSSPEKTCISDQQHLAFPLSAGIDGVIDSVLNDAQQHMQQSKHGVPALLDDEEIASLDLQESFESTSSQDTLVHTALETPCGSMKARERLTPAMRQQRFKQQLCSDYDSVRNPNTCSQFMSLEDAVRHLLPYHTCSGTLPSHDDLLTVDKQFENVSELMLKSTTDMLSKYRQLLLAESQQESPSAEMVMLERLFLQSERLLLGEERHKARSDPESLLMSLRKASWYRGTMPSHPSDASASPPSPPAWALHSDRPPGLKTYCSRGRGALRLTIKHESGSRKVIHNSVCDEPHALAGHKRTLAGQLTNKGRNERQWQDKLPHSPTEKNSKQNQVKADVGDTTRTACTSITKSEHKSERAEGSFPDVQPPEMKRSKVDVADGLGEEGGLSEHLQSAIDSILELQRLQGPAAGLKPKLQPCGLEQSISCVLEGEM